MKPPKRTLTLRLPPDLHDRLLRESSARSRAVGLLVEDAVRSYLSGEAEPASTVPSGKGGTVASGEKCWRCGCIGGKRRTFPRCECGACHV